MSVEPYRRPNVPEFPHLRDTSDHVDNERPKCAEDSDVLPAALPDGEDHTVGLAVDETDVDIGVPEVLGEGSAGTLDGDKAGLDGDVNTLRNVELFGLENVPHLGRSEKLAKRSLMCIRR